MLRWSVSYPMKNCIDCKTLKHPSEFNRNKNNVRPECKVCEKARKDRRKAEDLFLATVNLMADGILKRTVRAVNSPKNRIYKERNIVSEIGNNRAEIRDSLVTHFADDIKSLLQSGQKPSVDRIDSYGNYSVENIQIATLTENLSRIDTSDRSIEVTAEIDNATIEFESISATAKTLGIKRDTIYHHLNKGTRTKKGYAFYT